MSSLFSLILSVIVIITGIFWFYEKNQKRKNKNYIPSSKFIPEFSREYFPLLSIIFIIRSFIVEPFQIPSGSMMPTLYDGDFIAVNKFNYAIKNPITGNNLINLNNPERGDIVVFKYPVDGKTDYIKRVIGKPGDKIIYENNELYIVKSCKENISCGKKIKIEQTKLNGQKHIDKAGFKYKTSIDEKKFNIFIDNTIQNNQSFFCSFSKQNICRQKGTKNTEFIVPNDHYFVLGDNRSHSLDSRFWGFVHKENIVGNAFFIWISFDYNKTDYLPSWIPSSINLDRIGSIN